MFIRLALTAAVAAALATPTVAGCYEGQGCTDSARFSERFLVENAACDILWQIRNQMYHENGYCFRTPRGIRAFGNAGCRHDDINEVRLNQLLIPIVTAILTAPKASGFGFAIPAATLPVQGTTSDRQHLDALLAAAPIDTQEFGNRYRLRLTEPDTTLSTPVSSAAAASAAS